VFRVCIASAGCQHLNSNSFCEYSAYVTRLLTVQSYISSLDWNWYWNL